MKRKPIKWNITVPIVLSVVLVLIITTTLALFTETGGGTRTFTLSNFTSDVLVYTENPTTHATTDATLVGSAGGGDYYAVPLNDIANLHVDVLFQGKGVGLIRVHLAEEWSKTVANAGSGEGEGEGEGENVSYVRTVYPYKTLMPYTVSGAYDTETGGNQSAWFDNRGTDMCFYYATPVNSTNQRKIALISGVDTSDMDFGAMAADTLRILVKVDVVQVNRYPQYWNINTLPWSGASSASQTSNPGAEVQQQAEEP